MDCGKPVRMISERCWDCHKARVTKTEHVSERIDPIVNFEPMRVPIAADAWEGRPHDDPRNNWRLPNRNTGQKVRDPIVSPIRICVFDLEATALDASFGRILCAVFQFFSPDEQVVLRADNYEPWKQGRRADDSVIVTELLKKLESADVLVAHNGVKYDMAFIRSRAIINRLPPVEPRMIVDPVWLARKQFRFHSNSLDSLSTTLGTSSRKTPLDPRVWTDAYGNGSAAAMDEIVDHCIKDVETLCEMARLFQPYVRQIDVLGSFRQ